jgi:hypothetical protein
MSLAEFHAITPTNEAGNNSSNANASSTRLNWAEVMEQEDDGTSNLAQNYFLLKALGY